MQKSHSRKTYPADKMIPLSTFRKVRIVELPNGRTYIRKTDPKTRAFYKKFHTRKSRRYLMSIDYEEE